jgi:hypothetical protein
VVLGDASLVPQRIRVLAHPHTTNLPISYWSFTEHTELH